MGICRALEQRKLRGHVSCLIVWARLGLSFYFLLCVTIVRSSM